MSSSLHEIDHCEVCGARSLRPVLDLGLHPMCDDLVQVGDRRVCREYPIQILYCDECRTAHQRFQIPKHELFPPTYHYRSRHTADVLDGMRQLVGICGEELGSLAGKVVLDVGCNDGSLLSIAQEAGARTYGIEPTGAAADAAERGHTVVNDFLSEQVASRFIAEHGQPDIITFTNVFAHIEDLAAVVRSLMILSHPKTAIVIENHYLGSVLERRQFDTFYHEHPRTYSYTSFAKIADSLGRSIARVEFPKRYGGNIRVILRERDELVGHQEAEKAEERESSFGDDLVRLGQEIEVWKVNKRAEISAAVERHGPLSAKAFPGRAAIPIKLLDLDSGMISATHEKPASGKIGHYVPGTRIPIRSDDDMDARSVQGPIVNMAWHIADEIRGYMRGRGYAGPFIDIIAPDDFQVRR